MESTLAMTKGLADGNRMRIVAALMEHDELCACQLTEMLGLAGATVSRHLSILLAARMVRNRKQGRWIYYRLAEQFPKMLQLWLKESLVSSPDIQADRESLKTVLACDPDELCRRQRKGAECSA
ncbi:transcriptional regulator, ArsR family [Desulfonatronum thiosulfatophilum]|uniref:Transcriptional regulator, ArsR family n=1 Tax=Desulfonatronum thiosulfatophilum TaxID=617002 RepID=A0A1G6E952_9BACT|nr:metalloregulator ArsR/SmtB family transcription factor [Desulfonatronum thiosulfatophilum]SDB53475.1 transcriptional regulator, ArsR family [Desulfonatronum thiosulfatophilum]